MVCPPRAVTRQGALMSVTPNFCCDQTKNRGAYTRVTLPYECHQLTSFLPPLGPRSRLNLSQPVFQKATADGCVTQVYAPRFFVSSQQKFGEMDIKAPWRVTALRGQTVLQLLNQCYSSIYLDNSRKIHLRSVRAHRSKDGKRRSPHRAGERGSKKRGKRALAPLFICFSVPGPIL